MKHRARFIHGILTGIFLFIYMFFSDIEYASPELIFYSIMILLLILPILIPYGLYEATEYNRRSLLRKEALDYAKKFLAPYKSIWKDLKLSNKYCILRLIGDGITIVCTEKKQPYRKFTVVKSNTYSYEDLWNLFCAKFDYETNYDILLSNCNTYDLLIHESSISSAHKNKKTNNTSLEIPIKEKLDINNCTEVELTELPGINIVMAKKAIKKREAIGGFKTIDDFIIYLRIKPHIEFQLRKQICVNKMNTTKKILRKTERSLDL